MAERSNTTIAIVATNALLDKAQCQRVAWAAHDGIGRACIPAHTPSDGDLIFSLATGEKNPLAPTTILQLLAMQLRRLRFA